VEAQGGATVRGLVFGSGASALSLSLSLSSTPPPIPAPQAWHRCPPRLQAGISRSSSSSRRRPLSPLRLLACRSARPSSPSRTTASRRPRRAPPTSWFRARVSLSCRLSCPTGQILEATSEARWGDAPRAAEEASYPSPSSLHLVLLLQPILELPLSAGANDLRGMQQGKRVAAGGAPPASPLSFAQVLVFCRWVTVSC
jgi:hypothetical protein